MAQTRYGPQGVGLTDGRFVLFGGSGAPGQRVETYSPATNSWSRGSIDSSDVDRRGGRALLARDGMVYLLGGARSDGAPLNEFGTVNLSTGLLMPLAPCPLSLGSPSFVELLDGRLLVIGGREGGVATNAVLVYDPARSRWSR